MMIGQRLNAVMTQSRIDRPCYGIRNRRPWAAGSVLDENTSAFAAQLTAFLRNCRKPIPSSNKSNSVNATRTASNDR